ncbi:diguanylate cyclase/phosphodiesterase (GGDEF & EAL domains) with PAS/PAC sensor(s) [hydrothermal vent metagenome]|uniref:Diguanylate cyclase/phosphodiesterase (GGDEF & EAL domains) with PAS/PAC sensor(S) n=1 Tax=hydrothermal vent metagenome TaxID=652676 RepID=A0A3B1B3R9_9ZZZZ
MIHMQLAEIMSAPVVCVHANADVSEALRVMAEKNISSIVVVDNQRPIGILTERSLVKMACDDMAVADGVVGELMTTPVITATLEMDYHDGFQMLVTNRIRHLPIVNEDGTLVGVVTETDFLDGLGMEYYMEFKSVKDSSTCDVFTLDPSDMLIEAAQLMNHWKISCIVVQQDGVPIGIISERDMVQLIRDGVNFQTCPLERVMSQPVQTAIADMPLCDAAEIMKKSAIRRLVVVDEDGRLDGLLTKSDVLKGLQTRYTELLKEVIDKQTSQLVASQKIISEQAVLDHLLRTATNIAVVTMNLEYCITYFNPMAEKVFGHIVSVVLGKTAPDVLAMEGISPANFIKLMRITQKKGEYNFMLERHLKDGTYLYLESRISGIWDRSGDLVGYVLLSQDITERRHMQARIEYQATHDALTGLPNRTLLLDRLELSMERAKRHKMVGALLFIDLDHFKNINDSLGHPIGDGVLHEIARRLEGNLRSEDTVARLGGDEFVALLAEEENDWQTVAARAQAIAEKLNAAVLSPLFIKGHELHVSASVGVALFPHGNDSAADVLKHADTAMYRGKESGRNAIRFFSPRMQKAVQKRLEMQNAIRRALRESELTLHFAPQVNASGDLLGVEALLRWHTHERGMVPPAEFIPIAEECGLILQIGEWVLHNVCIHLKRWVQAGLLASPQRVAINISPKQLRQPNFFAKFRAILEEHGIDPSLLELEITENLLLTDIEDTANKMNQLKELGVLIAVDDFGTGYSSLSYIKRLPLDILKIDRSFVRDVNDDPNDAGIVDTIIAMARHMELDIIAEGVETREQLNFLIARDCNRFQGYYFSRPLPEDELLPLLKAGNVNPG